jgi:hypothetical protein
MSAQIHRKIGRYKQARHHDQSKKDPAIKLPVIINTIRKSIPPPDFPAELLVVVVEGLEVTLGNTVEAGSDVTVD